MALTKIDDRGLKTPIDLLDNEKIRFGTGNDLELYHDGSNSYLKDSGNGSIITASDSWIYWKNAAANETIIKGGANSQVELYYDNSKKLETYSNGVQIGGAYLYLPDNVKLGVGDSYDLQIYHDGSDSYISDQGTGNLNILSSKAQILNAAGNEAMAKFTADGAVELYYNNSKKLETLNGGGKLSGQWNADGLDLDDNANLYLGTGNDLVLYHNGSNSYIASNTGHLLIKSESTGDIYIRMSSNQQSAAFIENGAVELYYDDSKKLETDSEGVNVTGRTKWTGGTNLDTQSVYLSAGANVATQIGMFNGHGVDQGFCFYNNGSSNNKSWGMITNQSSWFLKRAAYNIGNASNLVTGWTNVLEANSGGDLDLKIGNLKVSSGKGIDFSAVGGPLSGSSSNSQLFEDYERGSWTMGFEYYNTTTSAWTAVPFDNSPDYTSFDYVKCGHLVHVWGYTGGFDVGSDAVNKSARFTGLPYAAVWAQPYYGASCIFTHTSAFGDSSGNVEYVATGYTPYNLPVLYPVRPKSDQLACWMDGSKTFMFSATYETAS